MTWFLRLFSAFREIEARLHVAKDEVCLLQQALKVERARVDGLHDELVTTLRRTADAMSRQATGRNVFERASEASAPEPVKPEKEPMKPPVNRRRANQAAIEEFLLNQRKQADESLKAQGLS